MGRKLMKSDKTTIIFLKRCIKYFLILGIFIVMIAPLYFQSFALAKQLTIDKSYAKLQDGVDSLEMRVMRAQEITRLLRQEDSFRRLFFLKGTPASEYYVDFNSLQSKLRSLSLTQDMFSNVYIMFKDNPVFVSNYISSDSYQDVFQKYYYYQDLTSEEWRQLLFADHYSVRILPGKQAYSAYYSGDYFEHLTVLINNSYYNALDQKSVMVIDFDKRDIIDQLLYEDQWDDHFVYIADSEGNIVLSHNYQGDQGSAGVRDLDEIAVSGHNYIALTNSSSLLGLQTVIGIPLHVFESNVNSLLDLVIFYVVAGSLIIIGLLLYFSMKETLWLKKLLEAASKATNTIFNASNEYNYIKDAFAEITTMNEEQLGKIEALNDSIKHSVLKNMLIFGVYMDKEREEIKSFFGNRFDCFCIAKLIYRLEESPMVSKSTHQNMGLEIEQAIETNLMDEFIILNLHADETVVVLFPEEERQSTALISEQFEELIRLISGNTSLAVTINIGLSQIMTDVSDAKLAYQQAMHVLSIHENEVSGGVYTFEPSVGKQDDGIFNIVLLLKLYDALIAGEKSVIMQIFADSLKRVAAYSLSEQEQMQLFFSFRQTIYNAHKVIVGDSVLTDQQNELTIPVYDQARNTVSLFQDLQQVSLGLCDMVISNRKSNNEKLKQDILQYIDENYSDLSLSASTIAAQLFISEKYVFAFIKEHTGKSLGKYIEDVRITAAERLLIETDYPNSKILRMCGFGSENTFYRAFSKKHVVSPTVWRDNQKNLTP